MADTKDFGPFYTHTLRLSPGSPPVHTAPTHEVDSPFRKGRGVVFRGRWDAASQEYRARIVGIWYGRHPSEEAACNAALQSWGLDVYEEDLEDVEVQAMIRDNLARHTDDVEEEWTILSHLGVQ